MCYREIRPAARLRTLVESYWILEHDGSNATPQRVVPDGHPELILNLGQPFEFSRAGEWYAQPRFFLAGQIDGPLLLKPDGRAHIVGVCFQPHGAAALFGEPMHRMTGCFTPVDALSTDLARDLERALDSAEPVTSSHRAGAADQFGRNSPARSRPELRCASEFLKRVEAALSRVLEGKRNSHDSMVPMAVRRMILEHGHMDLASLAREYGLGLRQFERRFSSAVGLSPKLFCRMRRFLGVFSVMAGQPLKWVEAALACGYFDQSHLIRDFKQFTGETPAVLLAGEADLARHFLERFGMSHSSNTSVPPYL